MDLVDDTVYRRVRIDGCLRTTTPLHVGSGDLLPYKDRVDDSEAEGSYQGICLLDGGAPYLPGSTLRGFLRDQTLTDPNLTRSLFGEAAGDTGVMGRLRVCDAPQRAVPKPPRCKDWSDSRQTAVRHGVALNPRLGVAEAHKLFRHEYLPAGSRFDLHLEAEDLSGQEIRRVLGLLKAWDGSAASAIGKGVGKGQGRLVWELEKLSLLDEQNLCDWLTSDRPLETYFRTCTHPPDPSPPDRDNLWRLDYTLHPTAPILVHDPGLVLEDNEPGNPDLEFSRDAQGRPVLPASSLRGMLRGRARRILLTLAAAKTDPAAAEERVDRLLEGLFGSTSRRSPLWLDDAIGSDEAEHKQTFNAIDRFTGGVASQKLYTVRGALCRSFSGAAYLERWPDGDWWKGLLVLVLRDALEGDLALGWGKARGYGSFCLSITLDGQQFSDWPTLYRQLPQARDWVGALHQKLDNVPR